MIEEILAMEKKSKNIDYKNQSSAWTGDTQGFEYIHNNPIFDDFFIAVKKASCNAFIRSFKISLNLIINGVFISLLLSSLTSLKRSILFSDSISLATDIFPLGLIEKYLSPHLSML